jgi:polyphosphate kinase
MNFPNLGRSDLVYQTNDPLPIPGLSLEGSMLEKISERDYLLNARISLFVLTKFFAKAALDPKVTS